jgi:hypothetical protein
MAPALQFLPGMMITIHKPIFSILFLISVLSMSSCARRVEVRSPNFVRSGRFAYVQDPSGRWFIVAKNTKGLDEAMKHIRPGPASVDKLDLWIITPLESVKH